MNNEVTFPQSVAGENVTIKRGTWKDHGRPAKAWFWGVENAPTADKGKLALIATHKGMVRMTDAETGAYLSTQGVAGKFWLSEYTEPEFVQSPVLVQLKADTADEPALPTEDEKAQAAAQLKAQDPAAEKVSKSKKVSVKCPCGCGGMTKPGKTFIQGHDAKLSAKLFAEVGKNRITAQGAVETMAHYSDVLAAKLAARLDKAAKNK